MEFSSRPLGHRIGRGARASALFGAFAFVLAGCFVPLANYMESVDPTTMPWWCDSTGGGHGDHVMDPDPYAGIEKGELSWEDCHTNSALFQAAAAYAQQWPTAGDAQADGWYRVVPYAQGMGTHHVRLSELGELDDVFDGTEPEFLMYGGNGSDAPLTGMAWWVESVGGPPEGFAGDNDWWHQHPGVCLRQNGTWLGQNMTDQECIDAGGVPQDTDDFWMVHAWIVNGWQLQFDVFQNHHPCIQAGGVLVTDKSDPCWMEAMHGSHTMH